MQIIQKLKEKKLKIQFEEQLPDVLDMTANSLKAGLSFLQALAFVSEEVLPPASSELKKVLGEIQLGIPMEEAFSKFSRKMKSRELDIFLTAILITRETGGNLAEITKKISKTIRERQQLKNQIKTLTSQGRLSGIIIGTLPFILLLGFTFIDPSLMKPMFTTYIGVQLILASIFMELIGLFIIKKIVTIDL